MDLNSILDVSALFATLGDLVSINSVNPAYPGGPGELAVAEYVAEFFRKHSIPFEFQTVFEDRPNVIARLQGKPDGRTLILEAHMDTASELDMSVDPFKPVRRGDRLYGRGSCDTKGGLAAMMHAIKVVHDLVPTQASSVILVASVDEEHSFRGVIKFLEKGWNADGAIVAEPTELDVVVASKGVLRWRVRTRGRAAHSSKPRLGVNAVVEMAKLIVALEEHLPAFFQKCSHPLLGVPTLNVGIVRGGIQVNQVPDSCTIEVDRRFLPSETPEQVWEEFEGVIAELQRGDPALHVEMEPPTIEDYPLETAVTERIVEVTTRVSRQVTGRTRQVGVPYGSDASKLSRGGVPSVILGPGSIDQAHSAEEYVDLGQVAQAAEIYIRTILEF